MTEEKLKTIDLAYDLFSCGMSLRNISTKLNIAYSTLKRWKTKFKWNDKDSKKMGPKSEPILEKNEPLESSKNIIEDIKQILDNNELTDKQQLFCLYYTQCFNAVKAYQKAYTCSYINARKHAYELLQIKDIVNEIQKLKQNKFSRNLLQGDDIFQRYMDIAFSDMTDYISFGGNKLSLKNSDDVDGSLIDEISVGKAGIKVKLADRLKALEWLTKHMDLATEEQKLKLDYMKSKIQETDNTKAVRVTVTGWDEID